MDGQAHLINKTLESKIVILHDEGLDGCVGGGGGGGGGGVEVWKSLIIKILAT